MRLQVLHLPAPADEYPFAIVIDQCDHPEEIGDLSRAEPLGARGVLVFREEVEVV